MIIAPIVMRIRRMDRGGIHEAQAAELAIKRLCDAKPGWRIKAVGKFDDQPGLGPAAAALGDADRRRLLPVPLTQAAGMEERTVLPTAAST